MNALQDQIYIGEDYVKITNSNGIYGFWTQAEWESNPELAQEIAHEIYDVYYLSTLLTTGREFQCNLTMEEDNSRNRVIIEQEKIEIIKKGKTVEKWHKQEWVESPGLVKDISKSLKNMLLSGTNAMNQKDKLFNTRNQI